MSSDFLHQHTAHCESGVMSTILKNHGLEISEPMVVGLSASIAFAYIPIIKLNGFPLIAYRMPPKHMIKGIQKRLDLRMSFKRFTDSEQGMAALDEQLDRGNIVGMQTSVYWLPYFPDDMRFHFNAHNLIVYGKEGDDYLISDPVFESPVRCHKDDLKKARFAKGALAPKGMMYHPKTIPDSIDWDKVIPGAIKANIRTMLAPIPIAGINGIHFLANKIAKLDKKFNDPIKLKHYIGHIIRMQEEIGTGGAGFRFIYASFLQESAQLTNSKLLNEASEMMTEVGDQWRTFALYAVKMCKNRSELDMRLLSEQLHQCANEERKVWKLLKTL
jgi:hypothetical protein